MARYIRLKFSSSPKDMPDSLYDSLYDLSANGIDIRPLNDSLPLPYDGVLGIEGGYVVFRGSVLPGGGFPRSSCVCKFTPSDANRLVEAAILPNDEAAEERILEILKDYGWI